MQTPLAPTLAACLALTSGIFCPAAEARGAPPPAPSGPVEPAASDSANGAPKTSSPPEPVSLPAELPPGTNEIRVTLFGQPCLFRGPLPAATLSAIHAVSPERIPAELELGDARAALERLRGEKSLPQALDRYRSRLLARLEAQVAFLTELAAAARSGREGSLLSIARKHAPAARWRQHEATLRGLVTPEALRDPVRRTALTAAFFEAIEPHPEAEFHRVLPRLSAQYACNFDSAE